MYICNRTCSVRVPEDYPGHSVAFCKLCKAKQIDKCEKEIEGYICHTRRINYIQMPCEEVSMNTKRTGIQKSI